MSAVRPFGVSILAVLYFIGVASYTMLVVLSLASPQTLTQILTSISPGDAGPSLLLNMGRGIVIYFVVMIVVIGGVAWGMWTLKNWSRWFTIIITAISLLVTFVGFASLASNFTVAGLLLELVRVGVCVLILWYLFRPNVKAAFTGAG
jgi:uncharacterized membrane protein (DUF2068 family)